MRILITGSGGYIGGSLMRYLAGQPELYTVAAVSVSNGDWERFDFAGFDAVFHAAGLAHVKETARTRPLFFAVNRDAALAVAEKAKAAGVGQFVYISSMSVYGVPQGAITPSTVPAPKSAYGTSKYEAEELLEALASPDFAVAILRPPMVYGPGCPGNYRTLSKWAKKLPVFPDVKNKRSMIYIGELCAFSRRVIDGRLNGVYCPQSAQYVCTADMVREIAALSGRQARLSPFLGALARAAVRQRIPVAMKIFGDLYYADTAAAVPGPGLAAAIRAAEGMD